MNALIKYSNKKPPIWDELIRYFPDVTWDSGVLVCYGDTYYSKNPGTPDLVAHETVHMLQQAEIGIKEWWMKYLTDPKFRLDQELPAYKRQLQVFNDSLMNVHRNERRIRYKGQVHFIATVLSSELYGNMISYNQVVSLIS